MPGIYSIIEKIARKNTPSSLAGIAKKIIAYPRYYSQIKKSRAKYDTYNYKYQQHILFVAGLPKSGTTWFEKMLSSIPGFSEIMIPEAVSFEQKNKQSHSFELPDNIFLRFKNALVVLKLHAHGSDHNFELLKKNNIRYVVMYRDLRDVAVSHVFYVKRTKYHPEHSAYRNLTIQQGLNYFAQTLLPQFVEWIETWQKHIDSDLSYILKYEELVANPFKKMKEVTKHYGISITDEELQAIINENNFEKLSGGRKKGDTDSQSFFRSGTTGDWKKYFDEDLLKTYNTALKVFFRRYGYAE